MPAPTLQQAEDALKAAQSTFETASTNLDRARFAAQSDGPRPAGYAPLSITDAKAAYDAALTARDAARDTLRDAQAAAPREPHWSESYAARQGRIG